MNSLPATTSRRSFSGSGRSSKRRTARLKEHVQAEAVLQQQEVLEHKAVRERLRAEAVLQQQEEVFEHKVKEAVRERLRAEAFAANLQEQKNQAMAYARRLLKDKESSTQPDPKPAAGMPTTEANDEEKAAPSDADATAPKEKNRHPNHGSK